MILAIDTATQFAGLALYTPDGLQAEETWFAGRNHTIELTPRLARMLSTAGIKIPTLTALAVSLGPGSFTGLRIGLAVAKGMALPHDLPIVGVPTLEVTAYPLRAGDLPVWAIAQAGRGRILAARYAEVDGQWRETDEAELTTVEALAERIKSPSLCIGEINQAQADLLERTSRGKAHPVSPAARLRRAGYLAEIAYHRLQAGYHADPNKLAPIYPSQL